MINYETIKSVYDDKLTLMQWLNKVQEALKDATAVSFNVNKTGDATLTFSIVFDDGTELETDPIILEQGESVESATLRNGHLILTLTNGDELDAGNMGAVSSFSIDANQHLIVTYQDGSTNDLGAIFTGNVNIGGNLTAAIIQANAGLKSNYIEPINNPVVTIGDISISSISSANSNPIEVYPNIKCFEKIVDSQGRNRFVEGTIQILSEGLPTGANVRYAKWSLSGTHLMVVVSMDLAENVQTPAYPTKFAYVNLPAWIIAKVRPSAGNFLTGLMVPIVPLTSSGISETDVNISALVNSSDNRIEIEWDSRVTPQFNSNIRVVFDLLIDND